MALSRSALAATLGVALAACDTPVEANGRVTCNAEDGRTLAMSVGEVATISDPAELACLHVEASASPSRYLFVPANVRSQQDVTIPLSFRAAESSGGAVASVAASLAPSALGAQGRRMPLRDDRIDRRIRAFESTLDLHQLRADYAARQRARGANAAVAAAPPTVGSTVTVRVPNFDDNTPNTLCDNPIAITTTVRAVGENAVILVDDDVPANGLTNTEFVQIAAEFDTLIYEVDTTYFGVPTNLDPDNGGQVFILYTPEVNKLSEPNSGSYVGGFFFSGDLVAAAQCAQSNETEIFYLLAADPTGEFGNDFDPAMIRVSTRGTIAHEFQHMINLGVRIAADVNADETSWLNEGLSHFAEELVGRRVLGVSDRHELTWAEVWEDEDTFDAYFFQNFARFEDYLVNPAGSSPTSSQAAEELSFRGAAWAFVRYISDHYSPEGVAPFTRALVRGPEIGIPNVVARTDASFEEQIGGWLIANWADDRGIVDLAPRYEYASWRMREAMACFASQNPSSCTTYPLKVTELAAVPATGSTLSILTGSGAYFVGSYQTTTPEATVQLLNRQGQRVTAEGARMFVLRAN